MISARFLTIRADVDRKIAALPPLTAPARDRSDPIALLGRTRTGRALLDAFEPLLHAGRVSIAPYPEEILARLREAKASDQPIGASFVTDGETGTIHVDMGSELGVVTVFLAHEIAHCLDEELWELARGEAVAPAERQRILLDSEVRAFDVQHRFLAELRALDPGFWTAVLRRYPGGRILHEKMSRDALADLYGLRQAA